jgi:Holliday junction resolvase
MKCLLIELRDKRKFFTQKENMVQLVEFCKSFHANMKIVKMTQGELLDLEKLVPAICDPTVKTSATKYEILENKISAAKDRKQTLTLAKRIQKYITNRFLERKTVSLKDLREKYQEDSIGSAALCNHLQKVKTTLENQGFQFIKVSAGNYKVI